MKEYYQKINVEPFLVLPLTYNVSSVVDYEFKLFEKQFSHITNQIKERKKLRNAELKKFQEKHNLSKREVDTPEKDHIQD